MNSVYFDGEAVAAGEMTEFIQLLCKQSYGESGYYNDIRIKPEDCDAFVVQWDQVPWSGENYVGNWEWVDEEHLVVKQVIFPDNHYEYIEDRYEEEVMNDWLKDHPNYHKNEWGSWVKDND